MSRRPPGSVLLDKLQAQCDRWNARYPIGTQVEFASIWQGPTASYKTRSSAYVLSGHTAVIFLEGKSGCVSLDHCKPAAEVQPNLFERDVKP